MLDVTMQLKWIIFFLEYYNVYYKVIICAFFKIPHQKH